MIHYLQRQGLSIQEIPRRTGHDRKTVRIYLKSGLESSVYGPTAPRSSLVDPYKDYIRGRLDAYPGLTAVRLPREIRDLG